jgi:hypothetical protein
MTLTGDYVAGFVDGEGCFAVKFRRDRKRNTNGTFREYYYWGVEFVIVLKSDDLELLKLIGAALGCGKISQTRTGNQIRLSVQNPRQLKDKVISFFKTYRLHGKKRHDFKLWCEAVEILAKYRDGILNTRKGKQGFASKPMRTEDSDKLFIIRNQMLLYKAKRDKPFKWGNSLKSDNASI